MSEAGDLAGRCARWIRHSCSDAHACDKSKKIANGTVRLGSLEMWLWQQQFQFIRRSIVASSLVR